MNYTELIDKIVNKKILLNELANIKIDYLEYNNLDIKDFIKEYQSYLNNSSKIVKLLDGLDGINFQFTEDLFSNHLANGLHDEITLWYIKKFPNDNRFLIDAPLSIEAYRAYGFPLKTLLSNGFEPNFEGIDWFFFKGNYEAGKEMCLECYYLLLAHGYKFSNPLVFYSLFTFISYQIKPEYPYQFKKSSIPIDLEKFMGLEQVNKWFQTDPIVITESHLQNFLDLKYYNSREQIIEELVNELGFIKNKFIKWPNVILNLHNYNSDQMDRTQLDICKYPLIGLDDNLEQEEFLI